MYAFMPIGRLEWIYMQNFMAYEVRNEFMYIRNITKSYIDSGHANVPDAGSD